METQKPLEQETPETTPQEAPTATIPQPESTPAANPEADPIPEEMDAPPESPAQKTAGKLAALIGGGIVAVLGIFYLVLCIVSASHGTILGRTDVMGVDMSGLTVPQAQERWQQKGQAVCQAAQLPLTLDGETAGQVSLWELGVSVTPETAAQLAYDAGHSGHFLENGWSLLRSWFRETSLTPPWTADDAALQEKAAELAEQLDMAAVDGACRLEQGKEDGFLVTVPKNGRKIDLPRLTDALRAALAAGTLEPVTCAYEVVEAKPVDFDAFAETYAFCGEALMVDAVAAEHCEILFLHTAALTDARIEPALQDKLLRRLLAVSMRKNLSLSQRIFCTTPKTVRGRLLTYFSAQAARCGRMAFEVPFNRQQMADYLNLDRSALSKELCKMRDEGLLEFDKNRFVLKQLPE